MCHSLRIGVRRRGLRRLQTADDSFDFKTRIDNVLTETGFAEARPAKMTIDDLLKCVHRLISFGFYELTLHRRLLAAFHGIGVHFA